MSATPVPVPGCPGGRGAAAQRRHWFPSAAGSRQFRALVHNGSGCRRPGAALVLDDGDGLPLGEPGAGRERLIELARAQSVARLGYQIGLHPPQMRPRRLADPPAQAVGRAFQQRRPLGASEPPFCPPECAGTHDGVCRAMAEAFHR